MQNKLISILEKLGAKSHDKSFKIEPNTDLFENGVIDSLTLIQLVVELEKEFGLQFKYSDIKFENFVSVEKIAALLSSQYKVK